MNLGQAVKMAAKSISSNKGRSALTMLGIIIGIAAVMTIVSAINGYTEKTMEQYEAMGSNKLTVNIWNYMYDEEGNSVGKDYFPALYDYCNSISEYVLGVTPQANCNATVVYGTKSSANMTWNYDDKGNLTGDAPPSIYYGSDQYSVCNNLTLASGRDLSVLDIRGYKPSVRGNELQIKKVAQAISASHRPLLCAGGGLFSAGAREELLALWRGLAGVDVLATPDLNAVCVRSVTDQYR